MPARTFRYLGVVGFMNRPETMSAELLSLVLGGYQLMNAFNVARIRIRLFGCSRMPGDGPHKAMHPALHRMTIATAVHRRLDKWGANGRSALRVN